MVRRKGEVSSTRLQLLTAAGACTVTVHNHNLKLCLLKLRVKSLMALA